MSACSNYQYSTSGSFVQSPIECSYLSSANDQCSEEVPPIMENFDCIDFHVARENLPPEPDNVSAVEEEKEDDAVTIESGSVAIENDLDVEMEPLSEVLDLPLVDLKPFVFTETLMISPRNEPER